MLFVRTPNLNQLEKTGKKSGKFSVNSRIQNDVQTLTDEEIALRLAFT